MTRQIAPYGTWRSPITTDLIVAGAVSLSSPVVTQEAIYWTEGRPLEGGRVVIVRRAADGSTRDVTPPPFNVRTRVHEYGGGAFLVADGTAYFSHFLDNRLYRVAVDDPTAPPEPVTPEGPWRYADFVWDRVHDRLISVREDHSQSDQQAVNSIVAIPLSGAPSAGEILVSGHDFYAFPRLSGDGRHLSWLAWDHPNMPWDGTELHVAEVAADGRLLPSRRLAGGMDESIFQPSWSPTGTLYFVSDRSGWWNLYRWQGGQVEALAPMAAEFGQPAWVFGLSTYAFADADRLVCAYEQDGRSQLAILDLQTLQFTPLELPFSVIRDVQAQGTRVYFLGGAPDRPSALIELNLADGDVRELKRSSQVEVAPGYIATPQALTFPTTADDVAHMLYYPPTNEDFAGPDSERPPLLVISHGGPTSQTVAAFNLTIQYWTSRGFAVADVNYRGSTGYGRAYRNKLRDHWGIYDVDDCCAAAEYLVQQGLVDAARLAIRGGSAGGYTTMAALVFRNVFQAGASYFGVSDLEALALDTHKFESRYLDRLVGPYPARKDIYQARSPIHFTEQLDCPMIFFQGLDDKVVPPSQAEEMVAKLQQKGVPVAYVAFPGEGHGFRKAENIKRTLEAELYFYGQIFGFEPAGPVGSVEIMNVG